jgi:hypothetical protein
MWTARQANRVADWLVLAQVLLVAWGVGRAVRGDWIEAGFLIVMAVLFFALDRRRVRRWDAEAKLHGQTSDMALLGGRAGDEREAYIQLRAWANVGLAAVVIATLATAVVMATGELNPMWFAAVGTLAVLGAVQVISILWLQGRT